MNLPSGYKRLEYIQSTGNQYVDSGFKPNNNSRVVLDFEPTAAYSSIVGIFGIRDTKSATAAKMFVFWNNGANTFRTDYFGTQKTMTVSTLLARQTVDKDKNVTTIGSVSASNTASTGQCSNNLYLFCTNNAGTANYFAKLKLYSCKIYDNGTLVRDFIPCQTTAGEIGLWDDVNSVFYGNAGTGTFTAGPVIVIAIDKSEITELEYIQSSGTQYVDTGFKANNNTRVLIDAEYINTSGEYPILFGARTAVGQNMFSLMYNTSYFRSDYNTTYTQQWESVATGRRVYDKNKETTTINGVSKSYINSAFQCDVNLTLFCLNNNGTKQWFASAKVYSCQIYDNGTLIRDYIPAKLDDGTVGLYDKLNGLLYINAGTGTFISGGNVLNLPVNIGGDWKKANKAFVNIGGTWKTAKDAFVNIGGTWKKIG